MVSVLLYLLYNFNILPQKFYTAENFNIATIKSSVDYNNNGVDDYTDILLGARKDAEKNQIPAVFHRRNRENWKVTMELDDWIKLYNEYYSSMKLNEREDK